MQQLIQSRARFHWPIAFIALAVLSLAFVIAARGMAHALAQRAPARALFWHAGDPEALVRINEIEADLGRKADRARRVLAQQPLDGRAYRQLAEVEETAGNLERALALYSVAGTYSPRDRLSRAWLAEHAHARGDHGEALRHVDALIRIDAELREPLFQRLALLSADEGFRSELLVLLGTAPAWRAQFLEWWAAQPRSAPDAAGLEAIHRGLRASATPLEPSERALRTEWLLSEERWYDAYLAWAGGIDQSRWNGLGSIANGGFDQELGGSFDWRLEEGVRHRSGIGVDESGNRALRVEFLGHGVELGEITQLLVLVPGRHVVSLRARLDSLQAERGLVVSATCAGGSGELVGKSPLLRGSTPWRDVSFRVSVPADCPAQWLRVELASPLIDTSVSGVAWFDDFLVHTAGDSMDGAQ